MDTVERAGPASEIDLRRTLVLELPLAEASAKVRTVESHLHMDITDTTLTGEMRRLLDAFGWERSVLARRQLDALEAAFRTEPERGRLRERLVESWA